jgi:hypothetical protein
MQDGFLVNLFTALNTKRRLNYFRLLLLMNFIMPRSR